MVPHGLTIRAEHSNLPGCGRGVEHSNGTSDTATLRRNFRPMEVVLPNEILVRVKSKVATITLNRPTQLNAITLEMWRQLKDTSIRLGRDDDVRVIVIRGSGQTAFSSGADIKDFQRNRHDSASATIYAEQFEGAMDAVEAIPKPVISMIHGVCVGGGLELATATDLRIACAGSQFGVPIARISVVAGYREVRRLVALVGAGVSSQMLLTGEIVDSAKALEMGLVSEVVPVGELENRVSTVADRMSELAPLSHAAHKFILRKVVSDPGLRHLDADERMLPLRVFDSEDFREGRFAFREKRKPTFKGR